MRIVDLQLISFTHRSKIVHDAEGHSHPGPEHEATQTLTIVATDEGARGCCFGGTEALIHLVKPVLVGENPLNRERIWQTLRGVQRLNNGVLSDRRLAVIDMALWDLAGQITGLPINKLLGGSREKVLAYASTMCGDEIPGGLDSPDAYADFAESLTAEGYTAIKLHTWMPPLTPDPRRDIAACKAVRARVGPDIRLMLDCHHNYSRTEALYVGRALEELDFYWFEEPMNEHSVSSYVWLAEQLAIPIVGPETAEGKIYTRAEWIVRGAADISRYGAELAGITPLVKAVHLCEAFGVQLELHGGGPANLQVLGAMGIPGEYYERGLLHPHLDYAQSTPWLNQIIDPMDSDGYVHIAQKPGLAMEINWGYIEQKKV
ncbi:MAG TPA: enolase C-terminal domain-like protein [bacterium]|nr:enolase C-terminal domain-like protein [bacterium]